MAPAGFTLESNNDPVDTLSRICTDISLNPERRHTLYNCCNRKPSYRAVSLEEVGLDFPEVSYQAFRRACQARGDASPLAGYWPVLDHFGRYWLRGAASATSFAISDRAIREDCPRPIEWPGPLTRYVRYSRWVRDHREEWPHPLPRRTLSLDHLLKQARRYAGEKRRLIRRHLPGLDAGGAGATRRGVRFFPGARAEEPHRSDHVRLVLAPAEQRGVGKRNASAIPRSSGRRSSGPCSSWASTGRGRRICTASWRGTPVSGLSGPTSTSSP